MFPVEDPRYEKFADWRWDRWEVGHSGRDVQATVDEVTERVDLVLKVLLGSSIHLLQFFNWEARSAHPRRVEVADF